MISLPSSAPMDSPCVRNCCLNDEDICLGCGRSLGEITRWSAAKNADKLVILAAAEERRRLIRVRQSAPS